MRFLPLTIALFALAAPAAADDIGARLVSALESGQAGASAAAFATACAPDVPEACFAAGLTGLVGGVERFSQGLYRHGAMAPSMPAAAMMLGIDPEMVSAPPNPAPEPLDYAGLRALLEDFVTTLDAARDQFEMAAQGGDYVLTVDPAAIRFDLNGDGTADKKETLAFFLRDLLPPEAAGITIGFDRADAFWFAGYTQIAAAPVDLLLAHDFSQFFDAVLHRVFPQAGLPMQDYSHGGALVMDAESDAFIADVIAGLHTADFPVIDAARLAGVRERLKSITAFSRSNWQAILAETDDEHELVPSPRQTPLVPGLPVTDEVVDAWLASLDTIDEMLDGTLLLPHWRFKQGFDLRAYFETATETDLVMLLAGQGALPFLADGPIADADSFAAANRVFGDDWPVFAFWFN